MFEQIKQVGLTYVTHRYVWFIAVILSLMVVPNLMLAAGSHRSASDAAHPMMFVLGMPMLFMFPFLVGQAKMQFAHSRARLMPQFIPAHLTVLAGILLTLLVFYPFLLAGLSRFEPLGLLAIAAAIGVPALWGSQLGGFSVMLISLVSFYSLLTDWGLKWWVIEAAQHRPIHAVIAAMGAVFAVAWLWRICHMQEEMADYQNPYQLIIGRRTGTEAVEQRRLVASQYDRNKFAAWVGDWWHTQIGGYYGGSRAGLARVLRYGFASHPVELSVVFALVMVFVLGIFFNQFSFLGKSGANVGLYFFFAQFGVLMPGQIAGELMAQHRPRINFEMLLPVSRRQLIGGLFAVAVRYTAVLWMTMNAALGAAVAMTNLELSTRMVGIFLLLSAATTFASMAVGLRTAVWPSRAKRLAVIMPSWGIMLTPIIVWATSRNSLGDAPFLLMPVVLFFIGAWVLHAARESWLNLEFS